MKTPSEWLDEQVAARPDDFTPEERAPALAWIASVQADAIEACAQLIDRDDPEVARAGGFDLLRSRLARRVRALVPVADQVAGENVAAVVSARFESAAKAGWDLHANVPWDEFFARRPELKQFYIDTAKAIIAAWRHP